MRTFLLGALVGVLVSGLVVATALTLLARRPASPLPQQPPLPGGDVTVTVQEATLSSLATELVREQEPMIRQVVVDVLPDSRVDLAVGVRVTILGQTLDLGARVGTAVRVDDARLRVDVLSIEFAGLNIPVDLLPQSLRATLQKAVADASNQANTILADSGFVPLGVTSDNSTITVSLRLK